MRPSTPSTSGRWSRPARGGWIEMFPWLVNSDYIISPVPRGAGGLKYAFVLDGVGTWSPVPRGAGGLKFYKREKYKYIYKSRPARGGWIEIRKALQTASKYHSPVPRGAGGLKFLHPEGIRRINMSRPARGGWIEI